MSFVAREIGDAAFVNKRTQPSGVNELNLDVYLPNDARQWDATQRQRITNLGRDLFFSKKLSGNDRVSC